MSQVVIPRIELGTVPYEGNAIPFHHTTINRGLTPTHRVASLPEGLFGLRLGPHLVDFTRIIVSLDIRYIPIPSTAPS